MEGVTIKLTVPVATRGGNRLLLLTEFVVDQVGGGFIPIKHVWVLSAPGVGMETPHSGSPHPFATPAMLTPAQTVLACAWASPFHICLAGNTENDSGQGFSPNISPS